MMQLNLLQSAVLLGPNGLFAATYGLGHPPPLGMPAADAYRSVRDVVSELMPAFERRGLETRWLRMELAQTDAADRDDDMIEFTDDSYFHRALHRIADHLRKDFPVEEYIAAADETSFVQEGEMSISPDPSSPDRQRTREFYEHFKTQAELAWQRSLEALFNRLTKNPATQDYIPLEIRANEQIVTIEEQAHGDQPTIIIEHYFFLKPAIEITMGIGFMLVAGIDILHLLRSAQGVGLFEFFTKEATFSVGLFMLGAHILVTGKEKKKNIHQKNLSSYLFVEEMLGTLFALTALFAPSPWTKLFLAAIGAGRIVGQRYVEKKKPRWARIETRTTVVDHVIAQKLRTTRRSRDEDDAAQQKPPQKRRK